ncbi:hypothetical protein NLC35_00405 [Candidatus Aminicenantes bacterium AC-334-K16]|jgi:hypothetical protein|nr:hypothetical protein [Candidatus Aminicenantes bacterium AC-334-K16]
MQRRVICFSVFIVGLLVVGMISSIYGVEKSTAFITKVKVKVANIQSLPSLKSPVVRKATKGTLLEAFAQEGGWFLIFLPQGEIGVKKKAFIPQNVVEIIYSKENSKEPLKERKELEESTEINQVEKVKMEKEIRTVEIDKAAKESVSFTQQAKKSRTKENPFFKRVFLTVGFDASFQEETVDLSWTDTIYYETASSNLNYKVGKGAPITLSLGYRFSQSFGMELGADIHSRKFDVIYSSSIPHPLLFNTPRTGEGSGAYSLNENTIFLNVSFLAMMPWFGLEVFAGPAYIMAEAEIISSMSFSESYPYDEIILSAGTTKVSRNVFSFNGGLRVMFFLNNSFALYGDARYIGGKALFEADPGVPGPEITLGGFRAGGGLKILF